MTKNVFKIISAEKKKTESWNKTVWKKLPAIQLVL